MFFYQLATNTVLMQRMGKRWESKNVQTLAGEGGYLGGNRLLGTPEGDKEGPASTWEPLSGPTQDQLLPGLAVKPVAGFYAKPL